MFFVFYLISHYRPPEHNTFYTSIDSMPEIKPRRKSIPFVSDLVSTFISYFRFCSFVFYVLLSLLFWFFLCYYFFFVRCIFHFLFCGLLFHFELFISFWCILLFIYSLFIHYWFVSILFLACSLSVCMHWY